jgi:LysR family transcriptional activator of nhaA
MEWLNYHHLLYFWLTVREGGVSRAADQLRLAQPTVSAQIRALENMLGEQLFRRERRSLVLTDVGRIVYRYADDIFSLGRELLDTVRDRPTGRPLRLTVGIVDVVPKLVAYRLLRPVFAMDAPVRVVCREGKADALLAALALHEIDVVVADRRPPPGTPVRAFARLVAESRVTFFAPPRLTRRHRAFPRSLDGAPFLLPAESTTLRRSLDEWFEARNLHPVPIGEFEDSALLMAFAEAGAGLFAAPTLLAPTIRRRVGARAIGVATGIRERFYAISVERRLKHPALIAIDETARQSLPEESLSTKPSHAVPAAEDHADEPTPRRHQDHRDRTGDPGTVRRPRARRSRRRRHQDREHRRRRSQSLDPREADRRPERS